MKKRKHFMSSVTVGIKGQIVIPKEIRTMFDIEPGDDLILMADATRGIAIQKSTVLNGIAEAIFAGKGHELLPNEDQESLPTFAENIKNTVHKKS